MFCCLSVGLLSLPLNRHQQTVVVNLNVELKHGYGRHIYIWGPIEGPLKVRQWRKILYVFELFFHTSTTLAKYSMLVLPQSVETGRGRVEELTDPKKSSVLLANIRYRIL